MAGKEAKVSYIINGERVFSAKTLLVKDNVYEEVNGSVFTLAGSVLQMD